MPFIGWTNSKFQTIHFLLGACHTAIDAHRVLVQQIHDKQEVVDANKGRQDFYMQQAEDELTFLLDCKSRLEAYIGFEPTVDDYQRNSPLEWKLELMHRAENFLLSGGPIPPQEIATMRLHPDWPEINQHVKATRQALLEGNDLPQLRAPIKEVLCLTNTQS